MAEAVLRRGELHISDPTQISQDGKDGFGSQQDIGKLGSQSTTLVTHVDGRWPSESLSQGSHTMGLSPAGVEQQVQRATFYHPTPRISAGPSMLNDILSNAPSKASLNKRKTSGFRATIRRIFGTNKTRDTFPSGGISHIHSVSRIKNPPRSYIPPFLP